MLFEELLPDGRWIGHAADHTLVAARAPDAAMPLGNAIGRVRVEFVDPAARDRVIGRLVGVVHGR